MTRLLVVVAAVAVSLVAGCSAPGAAISPRAAGIARQVAPTAPETSGPARWLYTDRIGAIFDPSLPAPTLPGPEPALLDGVRGVVSNGILEGWARSGERLIGFRRLPPRFGGGYAFWSDTRTYRADTFLGELTVLADLGAAGGIRPWLGSLLLRTSVGVVLLDPATHALRRAPYPDLADAAAVDELHALRLDGLGRASVTTDGGATWTDILATRGVVVTGLEERRGGIGLESSGRPGPRLFLDERGHLGEVEAPNPPETGPFPSHARVLGDLPLSSRALPDEALARVAVAGAKLPGDRWIVARDGGLQIFSAATALALDDADLLDVDEKLAHCQPITAGSTPVLLACAGEGGAEVLSLDGALGRPRLEMTFPEQGLFVAGPRDRLGFVGRCGPVPPSATDLGVGAPHREEVAYGAQGEQSAEEAAAGPSRAEPSLADDARYCARISPDRWVERRLVGDDARALYRFVPGAEGRVTALLLGDKETLAEVPLPARSAAALGEGVRVIRLDPDDPTLAGAAYPAVVAGSAEGGYRQIDADFWDEDDGAIRGWVRLPLASDTPLDARATPQGPAHRELRVSRRRGHRAAGVRIDGEGHAQISPLPEGVTDVVYGGRFGLASGLQDGTAATWETVDGGRVWTRVEGPPTGTLAPPPEDGSPYGCSAIGCTWGAGVVRLGWGSPPPAPDAPGDGGAPPAARATMRGPLPVKITCSMDTATAVWSAARAAPITGSPIKAAPVKAAPGERAPVPRRSTRSRVVAPSLAKAPADHASIPVPISLRLGPSAAIGALEAPGRWTGDLWAPFHPAGATRHIGATDPAVNTVQGGVIPLLSASPREPVELLLSVGKRRLRAGASVPSFAPFDIPAKITVAADGPDGDLVALDADRGIAWIARGDAVSAALRLTRVADVSRVRFTLGRRIDGGGLVLVGYSIATGEVFAGDLDLTRGEVGPLVALGGLATLTERGAPGCVDAKGAIRFLADLSTSLRIDGKGSGLLHAQDGLASFLIEATPERLCAAGMEIGFPRGKPVDLTVLFGRGGGAAVRASDRTVKGICAVGTDDR